MKSKPDKLAFAGLASKSLKVREFGFVVLAPYESRFGMMVFSPCACPKRHLVSFPVMPGPLFTPQ